MGPSGDQPFSQAEARFGTMRRTSKILSNRRRTMSRRFLMALACAASLLGVAVSAPRAETRTEQFAPLSPEQRHFHAPIIGVNVYYGPGQINGYINPDLGIRQIDELGADSTRDYLIWQSFKFPPSGIVLAGAGRMMRFLPKSPFLPLINLGHTNSFVPGGVPPITDEGLTYFGQYLDKAVELTRSYHPIYEIWNEWNMTIGTGIRQPPLVGAGTPDDPRAAVHYVRVAKFAVDRIRSQDPEARILVGAVGEDPGWQWASAIVRDGALKGADGLSIHLYNQCMPRATQRNARELIDRARDLQSRLKAIRGGAETPIYITEYGWPTSKGQCSMPVDQTADNFAQFILQSAAIPWIKGIWIHSLKNISPNPTDLESNFGLFSYDDKPKDSVCFVRAATDLIKSADSIEIRQPFKDVFVARMTAGARQRLVLWTTNTEQQARISLASTASQGHRMCDKTPVGLQEATLGPTPLIYEFDAADPLSIEIDSDQPRL
ncbi:hypothetical protein [Rhizobium rhizosphaerae]|nr:hypothetical protein [Xaviernesmea rhizosphaerae]